MRVLRACREETPVQRWVSRSLLSSPRLRRAAESRLVRRIIRERFLDSELFAGDIAACIFKARTDVCVVHTVRIRGNGHHDGGFEFSALWLCARDVFDGCGDCEALKSFRVNKKELRLIHPTWMWYANIICSYNNQKDTSNVGKIGGMLDHLACVTQLYLHINFSVIGHFYLLIYLFLKIL